MMTNRKRKTGYPGIAYHDRLTMRRVGEFQRVLSGLRYEGKWSQRKSLNRIRGVIGFFEKEVVRHMKTEEKELFPFLQRHIPRLESVICLLSAEHEDFRRGFKTFKRLFLKLYRNPKSTLRAMDNARGEGMRLAFLLKGHLWAEGEILHKTAWRELRPAEKRRLNGVLVKFN